MTKKIDTPAILDSQRKELVLYAKEGCKITATIEDTKKTLWRGLGNRSGLHSYADTLILEAWEKRGGRFLKRLDKLVPNTFIEVYRYRNKTRDRGRWQAIDSFRITANKPRKLRKAKKSTKELAAGMNVANVDTYLSKTQRSWSELSKETKVKVIQLIHEVISYVSQDLPGGPVDLLDATDLVASHAPLRMSFDETEANTWLRLACMGKPDFSNLDAACKAAFPYLR